MRRLIQSPDRSCIAFLVVSSKPESFPFFIVSPKTAPRLDREKERQTSERNRDQVLKESEKGNETFPSYVTTTYPLRYEVFFPLQSKKRIQEPCKRKITFLPSNIYVHVRIHFKDDTFRQYEFRILMLNSASTFHIRQSSQEYAYVRTYVRTKRFSLSLSEQIDFAGMLLGSNIFSTHLEKKEYTIESCSRNNYTSQRYMPSEFCS